MKSSVGIFVVLILVLLVAGFFTWRALGPHETAKNSDAVRLLGVDEKAGEQPYTDLAGNPVDLAQFSGKIRVVNNWASWSPFSEQELKDLNTLGGELGDRGVVIAINRAEEIPKIEAYINRLQGLDNIMFVADIDDRFYANNEGFAMPETVFYDARGQVVKHQRGVMNLEDMRAIIANMETE